MPASLLPVVNRKLAMEKPTANRKVAFAANAAIAATMIGSLVAAVILVTHRPQPLLHESEVDARLDRPTSSLLVTPARDCASSPRPEC